MARKRPKVADVRANMRKCQYTMMRVESWDELAAAEAAGAFGVEIEAVPPEVTAEIATHTSPFLVSMGGGKGGDCQYHFACDVLGYNTGHVPYPLRRIPAIRHGGAVRRMADAGLRRVRPGGRDGRVPQHDEINLAADPG